MYTEKIEVDKFDVFLMYKCWKSDENLMEKWCIRVV